MDRWRPRQDAKGCVEAMVQHLVATRLLQNPLGQPAAPGARGDIVRVSDGRASVYLLPHEYEAADDRLLRWLLAQKSTRAS
jgi:Ribosomal protein L9, N-terminal domain